MQKLRDPIGSNISENSPPPLPLVYCLVYAHLVQTPHHYACSTAANPHAGFERGRVSYLDKNLLGDFRSAHLSSQCEVFFSGKNTANGKDPAVGGPHYFMACNAEKVRPGHSESEMP